MPTFQYEAMDHTGREVKDSIDAATQEEAQQNDPAEGVLRHQDRREGRRRPRRKATAKKGGRRQEEVVHDRQVSTKQLCTFTRQFSTLQDAGLPILRSLKILEGQ